MGYNLRRKVWCLWTRSRRKGKKRIGLKKII